MDYEQLFEQYRNHSLNGRYITLSHIEPFLQQQTIGKLEVAGYSVTHRPIYVLYAGTGKTRVLLWSQMHGNESTATKALFDFFNLLSSNDVDAQWLRETFSFCFVPMLNPDGAQSYTRENAAQIDLNRDFVMLSQPESRCLQQLFESFSPNYCYNLHDQRTIFGAGDDGNPATISFLAPSFNQDRDWNECRTKAVRVINVMNDALQLKIPQQVGRFDDSYNPNCVGDSFQSSGVPTILIEAGHFKDDYQRDITRKHFFGALLAGFMELPSLQYSENEIADYLNIPENKTVFYDFVYKNVKINYDGNDLITNFAVQYQEFLENASISFNGKIAAIGSLEGIFGHVEIDAEEAAFSSDYNTIEIGQEANFKLGNIRFKNGRQMK